MLFFKTLVTVTAFGYSIILVRMVLECASLTPAERRAHRSIGVIISATVLLAVIVGKTLAWSPYFWY